jgi:chromate reductase
METVRLLAISGSARSGSLNLRLVGAAASVATSLGAEVTPVDLRALSLPLYDGDVEAAGMPAGALELRRLFATHDAVILSAPEYNGFVTPLLVNALDWTSRVKADGELPAGLAALGSTVAGLVSAAPGALGGVRGVIALRSFLATGLGMHVVPATLSVGKANEAFAADGRLGDERQQQSLERVVRTTLETAAALRRD